MSYCPRCGEQMSEEARFCQKCGLPINGNRYSDNLEEEPVKKDNSSLKRLGIIAAIILVIIFLAQYTDFGTTALEDEHVTYVKNGSPTSYPDIKYGDAFAKFFSNRHWKYFQSSDGQDVVEFTGRCIYRDAEVNVRMQFILDMDDGTFEVGYLAFNEVPQIQLITYALITKVFESY